MENYRNLIHNNNRVTVTDRIQANKKLNQNPQILDPPICSKCDRLVSHYKQDTYKQTYFYCKPCGVYYQVHLNVENEFIEIHFIQCDSHIVSSGGTPLFEVSKGEMPKQVQLPPTSPESIEDQIYNILLQEKRVMKSSEIIEKMQKDPSLIVRNLTNMVNKGIIKKVKRGEYALL